MHETNDKKFKNRFEFPKNNYEISFQVVYFVKYPSCSYSYFYFQIVQFQL